MLNIQLYRLLLFSHCLVWLFVTPQTETCQASLPFTISRSLLKSCPLSLWGSRISSVAPSPPAFHLSQDQGLFQWVSSSRGQSVGVSASSSVHPMNIQGWFPLRLTSLISFLSKGCSSLLQDHSSKASVLRHSAFFMVQLSHSYMSSGKAIALSRWNFVNKVMSWLFNTVLNTSNIINLKI